MSSQQQIVIQDACILFDLIDLNLLEVFFQLQLVVLTTPQVIEEIEDESQRARVNTHLSNGNLNIDSGGTFESIAKIYNEYAALSLADSSVLELAFRTEGTILSSDGSLRKITRRRNINLRGTIWIIEELFKYELLDREGAIQSLALYRTINLRAPKQEIAKAIDKLKKLD